MNPREQKKTSKFRHLDPQLCRHLLCHQHLHYHQIHQVRLHHRNLHQDQHQNQHHDLQFIPNKNNYKMMLNLTANT